MIHGGFETGHGFGAGHGFENGGPLSKRDGAEDTGGASTGGGAQKRSDNPPGSWQVLNPDLFYTKYVPPHCGCWTSCDIRRLYDPNYSGELPRLLQYV